MERVELGFCQISGNKWKDWSGGTGALSEHFSVPRETWLLSTLHVNLPFGWCFTNCGSNCLIKVETRRRIRTQTEAHTRTSKSWGAYPGSRAPQVCRWLCPHQVAQCNKTPLDFRGQGVAWERLLVSSVLQPVDLWALSHHIQNVRSWVTLVIKTSLSR